MVFPFDYLPIEKKVVVKKKVYNLFTVYILSIIKVFIIFLFHLDSNVKISYAHWPNLSLETADC